MSQQHDATHYTSRILQVYEQGFLVDKYTGVVNRKIMVSYDRVLSDIQYLLKRILGHKNMNQRYLKTYIQQSLLTYHNACHFVTDHLSLAKNDIKQINPIKIIHIYLEAQRHNPEAQLTPFFAASLYTTLASLYLAYFDEACSPFYETPPLESNHQIFKESEKWLQIAHDANSDAYSYLYETIVDSKQKAIQRNKAPLFVFNSN